jgi:hypothetical protein
MTWDINKPYKRGTDDAKGSRSDYIAPDTYEASIDAVDIKYSKNENPMAVLTWRVACGDKTGTRYRGKRLTDRIVLIESVRWKSAALMEALGIDELTWGDIDELERYLLDRACRITVVRGRNGYCEISSPCYEPLEPRDSKQKMDKPPAEKPLADEPPSDLADDPFGDGAVDDDDIPF